MNTIMVWNYQWDDLESQYTWKKIPTDYRVGLNEEAIFWRVIDSTSGTSLKEYFYSPEDYESFSGIPMGEYQDRVDAWKIQHKSIENEFNIDKTR
jgi:hypothetical protein